jgi:hypothetical protein
MATPIAPPTARETEIVAVAAPSDSRPRHMLNRDLRRRHHHPKSDAREHAQAHDHQRSSRSLTVAAKRK